MQHFGPACAQGELLAATTPQTAAVDSDSDDDLASTVASEAPETVEQQPVSDPTDTSSTVDVQVQERAAAPDLPPTTNGGLPVSH